MQPRPTSAQSHPPVAVDSHTQSIVEAILAAAPERVSRVLLFGSRARGDARPESDYDLLVLVMSAVGVEAVAERCDAIVAQARPRIDVHVMDVGTFERRRDIYGTLAYPAARDGVVLYAAE